MNDRQRNKQVCVAAMTVIIGALSAWWPMDCASTQPVRGKAEERTVLFLGNETLPPFNFIKNGKPAGLVVDLAEALAKRMHNPVEIRLMDWTEAQRLVLADQADALLQINSNTERLKIYDFSEPLLTSEFTIFTSSERVDIATLDDLRGLKVGVEKNGLPINLLRKNPQIIVEIIPDFVQGFRMLNMGAVDAVVADRWVGSFVLATNNIHNVKLIKGSIIRSYSAIAVKKGNTLLLQEINSGLADIRRDGTFDRIIKSWQPTEVVFKTQEQLRQQILLIAVVSSALIVAMVAVFLLAWQIRRRKRAETTLHELVSLMSHKNQQLEHLKKELVGRVAELEVAKTAADAANRAKSEFISNMSHEIRTPMNGVMGMAQLLVRPKIQNEKRLQYAQTILNAGHTLQSLLNDILDLSKVESGKLKLESVAFAVDSIVGDIHALFAEGARAKGLQLESVWQGTKGQCYLGDTHRLRQMLSNLVNNAIKFTDHGFVRIVACEIERQSLHAELEFSVLDSGIGLTHEQQTRLFQPFSQADSSTTRKFGGSGLGLSIVLQLSKLMGGEVGIDSEPGKGSRFWFRVRVAIQPDAQDSHKTTAASDVVSVKDLTGTILIAEDNLVNRMVIMAMLDELCCSGLTITVVEDGQQAVDFITHGGVPDLVLMDVQMPVMNGLAATEQIRIWQAEQGQPRVPIVALTANAFEEDRKQCLDSGMDDFLAKPLDIKKLQATLVRWLGTVA